MEKVIQYIRQGKIILTAQKAKNKIAEPSPLIQLELSNSNSKKQKREKSRERERNGKLKVFPNTFPGLLFMQSYI